MRRTSTQGFALTTVLLLIIVLMALVTAYFFLTGIELSTTQASTASTTGFYAAEAALNLRGEAIRQTFLGYNRPSGTAHADPETACAEPGGSGYATPGSADQFACEDLDIDGRRVISYVTEGPNNNDPDERKRMITIQQPEPFAGLNAIEYSYEVVSKSMIPNDTRTDAQLGMVFRSRLVPLFQFAAFYDKDLEISPGPNMTLNGRVHVNGDLYLNATSAGLDITGQVTVAKSSGSTNGGGLYRSRKYNLGECGAPVRVNDANANTTPEPAISCGGLKSQNDLDTWNGQIQTGLDTITTPTPEELINIGGEGWNKADLRIVLDVSRSPAKVIVADPRSTSTRMIEDAAKTTALQSCTSLNNSNTTANPSPDNGINTQAYTSSSLTSAIGINRVAEGSRSFANSREGYARITMLELDIKGLLTCMNARRNPLLNTTAGTNRDIDETSEGGLVVYATVYPDLNPAVASGFGVRVRNGDRLRAASGPNIRGLTIVSDQAMYIQGNYNLETGTNWKPASFLVDSINILSDAWKTTKDTNSASSNLSLRAANTTEVNAALLAGTDTTNGVEGRGGQTNTTSNGNYNGGLENYLRLHEDWNPTPSVLGSIKMLTYRGSFVSLDKPLRVVGKWGATSYDAPNRNWRYDERFNDAANLPPLSPRFVYLRQERFARDFER